MHPSVIEVIPGNDYILSITFSTGEQGILDMKPYLDFGVFVQLKDCKAFQRVRVVSDTIAWDCEVDLDPEFIHKKCCRINDPQKSIEGLKAEIYRLAEEIFENRENALIWLNSPIPALGGQIPMQIIETEAGAKIVMTILGRIEYGVYS